MENKPALQSEINVTPLVDVVLVLLIIFMVMVPISQKVIEVTIPGHAKQSDLTPAVQIIVSQENSETVYLNRESMTLSLLSSRLQQLLQNRSAQTVFFSGDGDLSYGMAVRTLDTIRNAGAENIAIITGNMEQTPH